MPEISPIGWASSYNSNETSWILQGGGLELLDIATIAKLKEVDSAASTGLSRMAHYQLLSDQLIVPHLGGGRTSSMIPPQDSCVKNMRYIQKS